MFLLELPKIKIQGKITIRNMLGSKVALVTGATSGIGRATALMLAREGARVVATGRNVNALTSLVSKINHDGGTAFGIEGDCTNDTDVERVVSGAVDKFGSLSILINNAGVLRGGGEWVLVEGPLRYV